MQQQTSLLLIVSLGVAGNLLHILTPSDFVSSAGTVEVSHGWWQITPWWCFPSVGLKAGTGRGLAVLLEQLLITTLPPKRLFTSLPK